MSLTIVPSSAADRAGKLESTRWSNQFNWQQLLAICEVMTSCEARAGEVLFEQGARDNTLGLLVKGRLSIEKSDGEGEPVAIATVLQSQSFGEMSLIDGEPRSARIVADTDVELLLLTREGLDRLVESNARLGFDVMWNIAFLLSQRLRKTSGGLLQQLTRS